MLGNDRIKYDQETLFAPRGASHSYEDIIWQQRSNGHIIKPRWGPAVRNSLAMPRPRADSSQTMLSCTPVSTLLLELLPPGAYLLAQLLHLHTPQLILSSLVFKSDSSQSPLTISILSP